MSVGLPTSKMGRGKPASQGCGEIRMLWVHGKGEFPPASLAGLWTCSVCWRVPHNQSTMDPMGLSPFTPHLRMTTPRTAGPTGSLRPLPSPACSVASWELSGPQPQAHCSSSWLARRQLPANCLPWEHGVLSGSICRPWSEGRFMKLVTQKLFKALFGQQ